MQACLLTGRSAKRVESAACKQSGVRVYRLKAPSGYSDLRDLYRGIIYPCYLSGTPAVFAVEDPDEFFRAVLSIPDPPPVSCPLTAEKVVRHLRRLPRVDNLSAARFPRAGERGPVDVGTYLDGEQARAAAHYLGPALVIAPAGSGKTTTLTARVVALVRRGIKPERILCLTFTRKAAREMRERLSGELGGAGRAVTVKTYHALAYRLIAEFEGRAPHVITDRYKVLQELMCGDPFRYRVTVEDTDAFISLQMNSLTPPEMIRADSESQWQMKRLYGLYREHLEKSRLYDQDFLLVRLYEMLRDDSEKRRALMDYAAPGDPPGYPRGRWHFVLVDECQDNNLAQDVLTRFFAAPWDNVFFVGDEDQLLYTFRGSDIRRVLGLGESYPCLKEMYLRTNYRCRPEIVRAAGRLIRKNVQRRDKEIAAFRDEAEGAVRSKFFTNAGAEYEWVAREIRALVDTGTKPEDIAVLYRINAQGDALALYLKDASIPYCIHRDGKSLFQHSEVDALLNHMILVLPEFRDTADYKAALLRSMVLPKRTDRIQKYGELLEKLSAGFLPAAAKLAAELGDEKVQKLCYQVLNLNLLRMPNAGLVVSYVKEKFIQDWYGGDSELERLDIVEGIASKFDSAAEFVNWVNRVKVDDKKNKKNGDSVHLMTVHSAKGLEFPIVFLADCVEGYFPYSKSVEEGNVEEERRVFYVGMTRARDVLYLVGYADKKRGLSRFLTDIIVPAAETRT